MTINRGNAVFTMSCTVDGVIITFGLTRHSRPFIVCAGGSVSTGSSAVEKASTLLSVDLWPAFALPLLEKWSKNAHDERLF